MNLKEEIEKLNNDQIRNFYTAENIKDIYISPIKDYILAGKPTFDMGRRINEVEKITNEVIIDRFINNRS